MLLQEFFHFIDPYMYIVVVENSGQKQNELWCNEGNPNVMLPGEIGNRKVSQISAPETEYITIAVDPES